MNYCPYCGAKLKPQAFVCLKCGCYVGSKDSNEVIINGNAYIFFGILGFMIPIVGLLIYLLLGKSKPKTAKYAGYGALISVILKAIFVTICMILFAVSLKME